jgi:alpha-tubulin suppressor-like RCC1 family protein
MALSTLDRAKRHNAISSDVTVLRKVICFEHMNIHSIACGENHTLAVMGEERNMLWAWGMYKNGQLGLGEVGMKMNPRPVQALCPS